MTSLFGSTDERYTGPYGRADQNTCTHSVVVSQKQVTFVMRQNGEKPSYKCTSCSKYFQETAPAGSTVRIGFVAYMD